MQRCRLGSAWRRAPRARAIANKPTLCAHLGWIALASAHASQGVSDGGPRRHARPWGGRRRPRRQPTAGVSFTCKGSCRVLPKVGVVASGASLDSGARRTPRTQGRPAPPMPPQQPTGRQNSRAARRDAARLPRGGARRDAGTQPHQPSAGAVHPKDGPWSYTTMGRCLLGQGRNAMQKGREYKRTRRGDWGGRVFHGRSAARVVSGRLARMFASGPFATGVEGGGGEAARQHAHRRWPAGVLPPPRCGPATSGQPSGPPTVGQGPRLDGRRRAGRGRLRRLLGGGAGCQNLGGLVGGHVAAAIGKLLKVLLGGQETGRAGVC